MQQGQTQDACTTLATRYTQRQPPGPCRSSRRGRTVAVAAAERDKRRQCHLSSMNLHTFSRLGAAVQDHHLFRSCFPTILESCCKRNVHVLYSAPRPPICVCRFSASRQSTFTQRIVSPKDSSLAAATCLKPTRLQPELGTLTLLCRDLWASFVVSGALQHNRCGRVLGGLSLVLDEELQ